MRSGNFSANEILFRRKQDQSELMILDKEFASKIEYSRIANHQPSSKSKAKLKIKLKPPVIYPGQLVYLKQEVSKHTARHLYIMMSKPENDLVCIKKILHFHSAKPGRYLNIEHTVKVTDLLPLTSCPDNFEDIDVLQEVKKIILSKPKLKKNLN